MVATPTPDHEPVYMSEAEYLAFEETNTIKHEYVNGMVLAMVGASWNHNVINSNASSSLSSQLSNRDCVVLSSDMRLKVESKSVSFRYPDTMIVCGKPHFVTPSSDTITNPMIIIEVLSPSTALEDRNAKLEEYTRIDSLQEYILISQDVPKVERFKRHELGEWLYTSVTGLSERLEITSINCILELSKLYDKVQWNFDQEK